VSIARLLLDRFRAGASATVDVRRGLAGGQHEDPNRCSEVNSTAALVAGLGAVNGQCHALGGDQKTPLSTLPVLAAGAGILEETMVTADVIGWTSSAILLLTIGRQAYMQWKAHVTTGVSRWLFLGQFVASAGFAIYSAMLHNWIFLSSNIAILITAVLGQSFYLMNRKHATRSRSARRE
jgi:MtN3 and saliva related transmembrane protein